MSDGFSDGGTAITLDVIAFIALACAFAVYGLYASAASLRDSGAPHLSLGGADTRAFPDVGVVTASCAAIGFFLMPWLARVGGYPAAATALIGVSLPMAAVLIGLRGWAVARLLGANSFGDLLARTYGRTVAILAGFILAAAATILLALALTTASRWIEALSAGSIPQTMALGFAALLLVLSGAPAGIRTAGKLARLHAWLVLFGAGAAIAIVIVRLGGLDGTIDALAVAGRTLGWGTTGERGGGDYNLAYAVAGAVGAGTFWTGTTILSVQIALGGTLLALVWLPWTLATADARRFARQTGTATILGSALLIGLTLVPGIGTLALDPPTGATAPFVPFSGGPQPGYDTFVVQRLNLSAADRLWGAMALYGLGGAAALHAVSLSLLAAAVGALRPIWMRRGTGPNGPARELASSQGTASAIVATASLMALLLPGEDIATAVHLAATLAPLSLVPFVAACWFPSLTRTGMTVGLSVGAVGATTAAIFSPFAVHAAPVGLAGAALAAVLVSRAQPRDSTGGRRYDVQRRLDEIFAPPLDERGAESGRRPFAILVLLLWVFFAIGPGIVIGNDLFGAPDLAPARWDFAIPSIAVWQLLAWMSGLALVRFLARRFGLVGLTRAQMDQITAKTDSKTPG